MDTESDGFFHYRETVSLMQISSPAENLILDPLAVRDLAALSTILADPRIGKVMHGSDYDVRSLDRQYGFRISGLYDTAIATSLLNPELMGLGRALETYLGIKLDKPTRLQRSDWSRRPLPRDALNYAAGDSAHLLPLHDALEEKLRALGRSEWMTEECGLMERVRYDPPSQPAEACFSAKGTFDLEPQALAVFRELYLLREKDAERMDRPPFKVISNEALLAIARDPRIRFDAIPNANRRWLAAMEREIMAAIDRGLAQPPLNHPSRRKRRPNPWDDDSRRRWQVLHAARGREATALGISPAMLWPGKSLEAIGLDPTRLERELTGESEFGVRKWQRKVFGPVLNAAMNTAK